MNGLTVVIPSKTLGNLKPCVEAVLRHEATADIIVIWDGDCPGSDVNDAQRAMNQIGGDRSPVVLRGREPFIFARNMNIGIHAADEEDVVLLNDDAILEIPHGFSMMQHTAELHPEIGIVSSSTNVAGNPDQHRRLPQLVGGQRIACNAVHVHLGPCQLYQGHPGDHTFERYRVIGNCPGNSFPTVAYVCVLIPLRTIQAVGLLDERFGGTTSAGKRIYGYEDNDYSRRVTKIAGLQIAVHDGCYVDHGCLKPTFRGDESTIDMAAARAIYLEKWGSM